jgi:hypothetical protein
MRRRLLFMAATLIGALIVPAGPAFASCAEDSGPAGAPVIFAGTAQAERNGYTRFQVEEVQAGPDLAPQVWVLSGQRQPSWPLSIFAGDVYSSLDVDFTLGSHYVVGASRSFTTGACRVSAASASAGQSGARPPVEDGNSGADVPMGPLAQSMWVAGGLVLFAAAVRLLSRFRRRGKRSPSPSA